jgi:mannose-6-phosphate isomerase-like protein (cupin superfamily)
MESIVSPDSLPKMGVGPMGSVATFFHGDQHDVQSVSLMLGELQPGEGPPWHRHAYDELFVVQEGLARFVIGENTFDAAVDQIVIARAGVPHSFTNVGKTLLKVTAIHAAPRVVIEWLELPQP